MRTFWKATLKSVSDRWEAHAEIARFSGQDPPWLNEVTDMALQAGIVRAIKNNDVQTLAGLLRRWDEAWKAIGEKVVDNRAPADGAAGAFQSPTPREAAKS